MTIDEQIDFLRKGSSEIIREDELRAKLEKSSNTGYPRYLALYRCASADVPQSPAWVAASDTGDWKTLIRPHTTNRMHSVFREVG